MTEARMIKYFNNLLVFFMAITVMSSCSKNEVKPQLEDGKSTVIRDLEGDTGASMADGVDGKQKRPFLDWYFSFKTQQKITDTLANAKTSNWDIGFTGIYNSMIVINNGSDEKRPGYGGPGKGLIVAVEKSYDLVTEAPTLAEMEANNLSFVGWDGYPQPYNRGWYFYDMSTHISVPVKGRTFVLLTADGKFAKLELLNIYKGNPSVVTDLHWPAPYFTFRYYVQQDGTRNLDTR